MTNAAEFLSNLSNTEFKIIVRDLEELHNTGIMNDGLLNKFIREACEIYSTGYNIQIGEMLIHNELRRRFLKNN